MRIRHSKMRSFETKHWMIQQREASRPFLSLSLRFRPGEAHSCEEEEESPEEGGGIGGPFMTPAGIRAAGGRLENKPSWGKRGRETERGRAKLEIAEEGKRPGMPKAPPIFDCTFPRPETCSRDRHTEQRKQTLNHRIRISSKIFVIAKKGRKDVQ